MRKESHGDKFQPRYHTASLIRAGNEFHFLSLRERTEVRAAFVRNDPHPNPLPEGERIC
jgi:hypothetical protein